MAEYLPLGVAGAVGVGMGLVDRVDPGSAGTKQHGQILYRGGGLAASLVAQHQGWGPPNAAPAAVASFAALFAARAMGYITNPGSFSFGQKLTNVTQAGALIPDSVFVPVGRYAPPLAAGATCPCGSRH
jgi:hypothetical protein